MGLVRILASFFGVILFECFCRDFYETWVKKVGAKKAGRSLKSIKDFIGSRLKAKLAGRDVAKIDWRGREGLRITEQVCKTLWKSTRLWHEHQCSCIRIAPTFGWFS
jgi:hypothetical protein